MSTNAEKVTIEIDTAQLLDQAKEYALERQGHVIDKAVRSAVNEAVEGLVVEVARERIAVEIDAVLAAGFQRVNEYGSPNGPPRTLREMVTDQLTKKDQYSSNNNWIQKLVEERLKEAINSVLKADIEVARANFRKMLDEQIQGKLTLALREAFGLKP